MNGNWICGATLLSLLLLTGCADLPGRAAISKIGLPSPQATISSAGRKGAAPRSARPAAGGVSQSLRAPEAAARKSGGELARGMSLERTGDLDKARKIYEEVLQREPENVAAIHRLGVVADAQRRHADAERFFLAALEKEPNNPQFQSDLGYCYYLQGRLDEAKVALSKATQLAPREARYHNNLGLVLGHQQDYDGAFAEFAAAGSEADAYYNMAFVFAAQDHGEEAKQCFQEALAADPNHRPAREALASFEDYERTPEHLRERDTEVADSGIRYVPFIEGEAETGDVARQAEGVQLASASEPLPASRHAGRATRTLQLQSRGLMSRRMQSQRSTPEKSQAAPLASANVIEVEAQ